MQTCINIQKIHYYKFFNQFGFKVIFLRPCQIRIAIPSLKFISGLADKISKGAYFSKNMNGT